MRKLISFSTVPLAFLLTGAIVSAQTPAALRLTVDDAVKMALDHNVDLNADRLDPRAA